MSIIGGLDVHRRQVTFDWLVAYPAEPAETSSLRSPKRRAKTNRTDARLLRELLEQGRLPSSWIPPGWILDLRTTVRLRKTLVDQRTAWQQRIHAALFHHGCPTPSTSCRGRPAAGWSGSPCRRPAAFRLRRRCDRSTSSRGELDPLECWLRSFARRQAGCRALMAAHYGIGALTAPTILAELGDARRFPNGDAVVRHTGLDVTVSSSDGKQAPGHLSHQGPQVLRWALFEAAMCAARPTSPDHQLYVQVKDRLGGKRAALTIARKLARRVRHTLAALGDSALAAVTDLPLPKVA